MSSKPFRAAIRAAIRKETLQTALDNNASRRKIGRLAAFAAVPDHPERRQRAHAVKAQVLDHLEETLQQFITKVTANGITVHRAADSEAAIRIFMEIAAAAGGERTAPLLVAKSKTMVSEEIQFNHAVEAAGMRVVETDLGEYIVQLRGERPSHIITPAVHLQRGDVGRLFEEKLGLPYTEEIPVLTNIARKVLREVFLTADIGISGVNFGVVETGTLALVTNEGNGRMCTTLPPVHVALMGLERLVPSLDDLALFLSLLPRSATGQKLSVYTSLIHAPRRGADPDGPRQRHLILVDNGRLRMCASPLRDALACIRCGACLNACPVFRETSGHAYLGSDGSIAPYPGPIGSVVSPGLFGCENYGHLAQASTLCGACKEACPVDIDLPGMLLRIRGAEVPGLKKPRQGVGLPLALKLGLKGFRLAASSAGLFGLLQWLGGAATHLLSPRQASMRLPAWTGWGYSKDMSALALRPFRARWKAIRQEVQPGIAPAAAALVEPDPPQASTAPGLVDQFSQELKLLGGEMHLTREADLPAALHALLTSRKIERALVDAEGSHWIEKAGGIESVHTQDAGVRAGVTGALCGIADTGSLLLLSGSGRPLTASLLPEVHAAVLRSSQLVATLAEALRLPEVRTASASVIITGPSRTADIEMTLTIGVHGPGELHVFLIDDSEAV